MHAAACRLAMPDALPLRMIDVRPVVNTEHPLFITLGFLSIIIGFIIEFFAVPEPKTMAQLRQEIKLLKLKEKSNYPK